MPTLSPLWWETLDFPEAHCEQVARLAEQLFDQTQSLHRLNPSYKILLSWAALLHDVGQSVSLRQHHKHGFHLIVAHGIQGLSDHDVRIVALIARYHRKANPSRRHTAYAALSHAEQRAVQQLASLIRLADAFDRSYGNVVKEVTVTVHEGMATFALRGHGQMSEERAIFTKKATLFEEVFGVKASCVVSSH